MSNSQDFMDKMYNKLDQFLKTETVIGEPIEVKEATLIPIITASFGLGGGMGLSQESKNQKDEGSGGGLGCKIAPTAILVLQDENVKLVNLRGKSSMESLIEMVPELLNKVRKKKDDSEESDE